MEYFSAANNTQAENTNNDLLMTEKMNTKVFFQDKIIDYLVLILFRSKLECFVTEIKVKLVHVSLFEMILLKCSTLMITLKP